MSRRLTVLMYHYVRDIKRSRYPEIKGLETELFEQQILYCRKHYEMIRVEDLLDAIRSGQELPEASMILTFDDGFTDHYTDVFPVLDRYKIQGTFFVPTSPLVEHTVLDVHKIQYLLAACPHRTELYNELLGMLDSYRGEFKLETNEFYLKTYCTPAKRDQKEIAFVKRMLQFVLEARLRHLIIDRLFKRYVSADEPAFSNELYMDVSQLQCLASHGMVIGSHSHRHLWMDLCSPEEQEREVTTSIDFLKKAGLIGKEWVMGYPYGRHNESLIQIIRRHGCSAAFIDSGSLADLTRDNPFALPRIATNDIPAAANAAPNELALEARA